MREPSEVPRSRPAGAPALATLALAALFAVLVTRANPAEAQPFSDPGAGFGVQAGAATASDADATPFGRLHARYRLTGMVGVEVAASYLKQEIRVDGTPFLRVEEGQLTGSFLLFFLYDHAVQPFLLGGGGYYYVSERGLGAYQDVRSTEHLFAFHAGGGVDVRVSRRVSVFVDGRYTFLTLGSIPPSYSGKADFATATAGVNLYF